MSTQKPSSADDSTQPDNVVSLSRYRALLARGRRARRADELLESKTPERAVRALPGDELYYLLAERGFPDAQELLVLASAEQVQTVLDFVLWDRDQLAPARVEEWLGAITEAPYERIGEWLEGLDVELVALLIRQRARIYEVGTDEEGGEVPDEPEGTLWRSPDGFFALDLLGTDEQQRVTLRLVDALYRHDINLARRLLVGTKGELDSELEEESFRWRAGRMADLGFVDYYEALAVYQELDPASVKIGEAPRQRVRPHVDSETERDAALRLPTALVERLGTSSTFARAVGGIHDADELAEVHAALVALSNRVLAADRTNPANLEGIAESLARVQGTLDLAVELLARGSEAHATEAVRTVPLVRLFRLGTSLVGKVRKLATTLRDGNAYARPPVELDLFEPEDADVLAAVTRTRPLFPRRLDEPPAAGERPFGSLRDLATATAALERAAAALAMLPALGVRPETVTRERLATWGVVDPRHVDAAVLGRTALALRLYGKPDAPFSPLPRALAAELVRHMEAGRSGSNLHGDVYVRALDAVTAGLSQLGRPVPSGAPEVVRRWAATLVALEPVLLESGRVAPPVG